ncbi:MAB_1171c family putative transporter [Lentzea sp. NPDC051213]|uniref:MAB_1171c family putative transporter n=1 Tax=Lentzea sp. NPDC051213 TaxID=3364126 RepID=UPI0037963A37
MTRFSSVELPGVVFAVLVVVWGFVLFRVRVVGRSPQGRAVALAFLCLATSATIVVRQVRYALDQFIGVPDLAILIANVSTLGAIAFLLRFGLIVGSNVRFVRVANAVLAGVVVVMVAMFLIVPRDLNSPDFAYWHPTHPATIIYHLVNITCMFVGVAAGAVLLHPLWRHQARGPLRVALFLLWLGFLSLIVYAGCRYWYVIAYGFGFVPQGTQYRTYGRITELAMFLGVLLVVLGGLTQAGMSAVRWMRRLRGYRRLRPLWTELVEAVPTVVLQHPPRWFAGGSLELRLYRRTVEIRDAQLELAGRVSPDTRAYAGMNLEEAGVTEPLALDACVLRIGLASPPALHPAETSAWSAASNLDDELDDLLALNRQLRDPAVVAAAQRSLTPL